jgi:hypothetical protein
MEVVQQSIREKAQGCSTTAQNLPSKRPQQGNERKPGAQSRQPSMTTFQQHHTTLKENA